MTVYVVIFSNYEPAEVVALYDNEAAAQARADYENEGADGMGWRVQAWQVGSEFDRSQFEGGAS